MIQRKRKILGTRNGLKIFTRLKANKRINPASQKRYEQNKKERELKQKLLERCKGLCEICHREPDWRGLSKHEKIFRSQGGDPLDENNVLILCAKCHSKFHGVKEK